MRTSRSNQTTGLWAHDAALWGHVVATSYRRERLLAGVPPRGRHSGAKLLARLLRRRPVTAQIVPVSPVIELPRQGGERDVALEPQLR